jgi:hypothetical protein
MLLRLLIYCAYLLLRRRYLLAGLLGWPIVRRLLAVVLRWPIVQRLLKRLLVRRLQLRTSALRLKWYLLTSRLRRQIARQPAGMVGGKVTAGSVR